MKTMRFLTVFLWAAAAAAAAGETPLAYHAFALTPPMGWNSYDAFGDSVTEAEVLSNAVYVAGHLRAHGWNYIVVDYRWYDPGAHDNNPNKRAGAALAMDPQGRLLPATNRFPSAADGRGFQSLAEKVHGLGLKFGIHVMRGIPRQAVEANTPIDGSGFHAADALQPGKRCNWCPDMEGVDAAKPAGQAYYDALLRLYAAWGVDFVKIDDLSSPYSTGEIEAIRKAIDGCGRPIVFSTSPGETPLAQADHIRTHANMWRISGDFWDEWKHLRHSFDLLRNWQAACGPGHWPDADMIPIGRIGVRSVGGARGTRFTRDEQVTLMTLWSIARSPLMLGADLPQNDAWTEGLLTNDAVLAVDQHGLNSREVYRRGDRVAWAADVPDSRDHYVALFNLGEPLGGSMDPKLARFRSDIVSRKTPGQAVEISADITGARKLYLVVEDGGDDFVCDHADWLEPRLSGPAGEVKLTSLKWVSATAGFGKAQVGRSVSSKELTVDGKKYEDGIGTHSTSVIEYELSPGYTRFTARGGLDAGGVGQKLAGATVRFAVHTEASVAVAPAGADTSVSLSELGCQGACRVRDLWSGRDLGQFEGDFHAAVPVHGAGLYRVTPAHSTGK